MIESDPQALAADTQALAADTQALAADPSAAQRYASDPSHCTWVKASAGSGKTKVLVDRLLRLMLVDGDPAKVLCLTYSKSGAAEMRHRLYAKLVAWAVASDAQLDDELATLLGHNQFETAQTTQAAKQRTTERKKARQLLGNWLDATEPMHIRTIHSFCEHLLKMFPLEAGVSPRFEVIDDDVKRDLIELTTQAVIGNLEGLENEDFSPGTSPGTSPGEMQRIQDAITTIERKRASRYDDIDNLGRCFAGASHKLAALGSHYGLSQSTGAIAPPAEEGEAENEALSHDLITRLLPAHLKEHAEGRGTLPALITLVEQASHLTLPAFLVRWFALADVPVEQWKRCALRMDEEIEQANEAISEGKGDVRKQQALKKKLVAWRAVFTLAAQGTASSPDKSPDKMPPLPAHKPDLFTVFLNTGGQWKQRLNSMGNKATLDKMGCEPAFATITEAGALWNVVTQFAIDKAVITLGVAWQQTYDGLKVIFEQQDFDDLIDKVVRLMGQQNPSKMEWILHRMDNRIRHFLVDEAQDTNPKQWRMLESMLSEMVQPGKPIPTTFVVGDEKQSIYGFQGSDVVKYRAAYDTLLDIYANAADTPSQSADAAEEGQATVLPGRASLWRDVPLDFSFRSAPEILRFVDTVFGDGPLRACFHDYPQQGHQAFHRLHQGYVAMLTPLSKNKEQASAAASGIPNLPLMREEEADSIDRAAADQTLALITALLDDVDGQGWICLPREPQHRNTPRRIKPGDILVLFQKRSEKLLDRLSDQLRHKEIRYGGIGGEYLLDSLVIRDLLNVYRFVQCPDDDLSLACVLKSAFVDLCAGDPSERRLLALATNRGKRTLWQQLSMLAQDADGRAPLFSVPMAGGRAESSEARFAAKDRTDYVAIVACLARWIRVYRNCTQVSDFLQRFLSLPAYGTPPSHREHDIPPATGDIRPAAVDTPGNNHHRLIRHYGKNSQRFVDHLFELIATYTTAALTDDFIAWIESRNPKISVSPDAQRDPNELRIMTMHGAKGLQAPIVIIPFINQNPGRGDTMIVWDDHPVSMPHWANKAAERPEAVSQWKNSRSAAEDARLLYVALTRAEIRLYIGGEAKSPSKKDKDETDFAVQPVILDSCHAAAAELIGATEGDALAQSSSNEAHSSLGTGGSSLGTGGSALGTGGSALGTGGFALGTGGEAGNAGSTESAENEGGAEHTPPPLIALAYGNLHSPVLTDSITTIDASERKAQQAQAAAIAQDHDRLDRILTADLAAVPPSASVLSPSHLAYRTQPTPASHEAVNAAAISNDQHFTPLDFLREKPRRRGSIIHKALSLLPHPGVDAALAWLENFTPTMAAPERQALITEFDRLLVSPLIQSWLTVGADRDVFVERTLCGDVLDVQTQEILPMRGDVDRIIVHESVVEVIEMKTHIRPPRRAAQIAESHLRQLAAYCALAQGIWPHHRIDGKLLWTSTLSFMAIDASTLLSRYAPAMQDEEKVTRLD
ncbi:MAG: UvrD-helicase domain-containing protein [Alphaproteobacteria bacterium]|nr:UvrD-helicase domain-containing protein [Alphaproteobacteria bacterium]